MTTSQVTARLPHASPYITTTWSEFAPQLHSTLRIVAAFTFMLFGMMKLFAFPAGLPPDGHIAPLFSEIWVAGMLETFGGALLLLGLFTRPVAFLLSGEMAVAYFQVHARMGVWPVLNNGVAPVLFCFLWLYISAAGPGPWSVDALRSRLRA